MDNSFSSLRGDDELMLSVDELGDPREPVEPFGEKSLGE